MSDVLWFNGRFTTTDERVLGVEDRGFLFGDAIYEVFKFIGRRPVFLEEHWQRLARGLAELEILNPWSAAGFREMVTALLGRTAFEEGIVYIEVSRGEGERSHFWAAGMKPTAVAFSRRFKFPDAVKKQAGVRLITAPDLRWKRCDLKSVNLLANGLAKRQVQRAAADEALLVENGTVRECASSSFFAVIGGVIVTHPLDEHILPSVTRARALALAVTSLERPILESELQSADELFITSTTLGVMPVRQLDGGPQRARGPVTHALQQRFDADELRGAGVGNA